MIAKDTNQKKIVIILKKMSIVSRSFVLKRKSREKITAVIRTGGKIE
jgi:hypothetical protein